jgi:hypothetical protein
MTRRDGPARSDDQDDSGAGPRGRFGEDLIGLDPADPEAQAFAAHLDRMERIPPAFTVEGSLAGVRDFAESANRAAGSRRAFAMAVVGLILLGVIVVVWDALVFVVGILL